MDPAALAHRGAAFVALRALAATVDGRGIGERVAADLVELIRRQVAPLAHGEPLQAQRSHLHAAQLLHGVTERQQHAADLAVAPLEQLHVEDRLLAVPRDHVEATRLGLAAGASLAVGEEDAALEALDVIVGELPRHGDLVALVHLVARMREPVGELAVVGHEQQARRIHVEPTDRVEPQAAGMVDEVDRARATLGIAVGADHALGLEEQHVRHARVAAHAAAVGDDLVLDRVDPRGQAGDDGAVHLDEALGDHLLATASAGHARIGKELLQADAARGVGEGVVGLGHAGKYDGYPRRMHGQMLMIVALAVQDAPVGTLSTGTRVAPAALGPPALVDPFAAGTVVGDAVAANGLAAPLRATAGLITRFGTERRDPNDAPWVVRCFDEPWRVADAARAVTQPWRSSGRPLQRIALTAAQALGQPHQPGAGQGTLPMADTQGAVFALDFLANGARVHRTALLDPVLARLGCDRTALRSMAIALARRSAESVMLDGPDLERHLSLVRASTDAGWAAVPALLAHLDADLPGGLDWTAQEPAALPDPLAGKVDGTILAAEQVDGLGWVVVGGLGANRYDMDAVAAVLDPGGDDRYAWGAGAPIDSVIVDLAGNDRYEGGDVGGPASGIACLAAIDDHAGNDVYRGGLLSVGAAAFGVGLLRDRGGDDRYEGGAWSIGAALYGAGILLDEGGADDVRGGTLSQGVGGPRGIGMLIDQAGDDRFIADFGAASAYGTPATNLSFAQGVGYGFRKYAAGGIGMLLDAGGDDRYEGGEFAQGGGYLHGLGVLHDLAGRDLYRADRYSQGFAAHMAFGALLDDAGDDVYWGRTAANQGAAWDASAAVLVDAAGNDHYRGSVLAQGSGAMQAIGMLIDLAGDDRYDAPGPYAQGESGNNTYHCGTGALSFSLLLDAGPGAARIGDAQAGGTVVTGSANAEQPCESRLHGVRIVTPTPLAWPKDATP